MIRSPLLLLSCSFVVCSLLSSCSSLPTAPANNINTSSLSELPIRYFSAWGKMSIRNGNEAGQLRFYWREHIQGSEVLLESLFGTLIASINRNKQNENPAIYYLSQSSSKIAIPFKSLEAVVASVLSSSVPIKALPAGFIVDTLLGQNQDKWRAWHQTKLEWQDLKWTLAIDQTGEKINIETKKSNINQSIVKDASFMTRSLPKRITIIRPPFSLRLAVEKWAFPERQTEQ